MANPKKESTGLIGDCLKNWFEINAITVVRNKGINEVINLPVVWVLC